MSEMKLSPQKPEALQDQLKATNGGLTILNNLKYFVHNFDAKGPKIWNAAAEADSYLDVLIGQAKAKLEALTALLPKPEASTQPVEATPSPEAVQEAK